MLNQELLKATRRFQCWMQGEALPLWVERGMHEGRVHYERLLVSGEPDRGVDVRVRVQARQAFSYANAFSRGWAPQGQLIATKLYRFLDTRARHPNKADGYVHLLNNNFDVIDQKQDLYDHAFYLLAFSSLYQSTQNLLYIERAEALMIYLDEHYASSLGGWLEGDYRCDYRRQNPHMHLFEAFMSLYESSGNVSWLVRASEMFALFQLRFYDSENKVVLEVFDENWQPRKGEKEQIIEPGHLYEWVWLLRWYEDLSGTDVSYWADNLYESADRMGVSASGLIYDEVNLDASMRNESKRLWPMTERIKASLAQAKAGKTHHESRAAETITLLFKYYLDVPVSGSWIDQRGSEDEVICDMAPASTLYHLMVACMEAVDYCNMRQYIECSDNNNEVRHEACSD